TSRTERPSRVRPTPRIPLVCTHCPQDGRARKAAVLTRFWHEVEQYRRVPLREVSTKTRSHRGAVQTPSRSWMSPLSTTGTGPGREPAEPRRQRMPELDHDTERDWIERWDRRQEELQPDREDRFTALIDAVEEGTGRPDPLVLDIGCGPGS